MALSHELFDTDRGSEPAIRLRFQSTNFIRWTLTGEDVKRWPQFPLQAIAERFYLDPDLWLILMDANPIKRPWEWKVGDVIIVPRDFQDALRGTSEDDSHLLR